MAGRVGDTPVPGAGGYCDDNVGTVSTTGHGDSIMRYCLAQRIMQSLENGTEQYFLRDRSHVQLVRNLFAH